MKEISKVVVLSQIYANHSAIRVFRNREIIEKMAKMCFFSSLYLTEKLTIYHKLGSIFSSVFRLKFYVKILINILTLNVLADENVLRVRVDRSPSAINSFCGRLARSRCCKNLLYGKA